jgi:hypothetical protein
MKSTTALFLILVTAAEASGQTEWRKYDCNPVLQSSPGSWEPFLGYGFAVLSHDGSYQLWYSGETAIGRATSPDGVHWEKNPASAPVLKPDPAEPWEAGGVGYPNVYWNGQLLVMHYFGLSSNLGVAISTNGVDWYRPPGRNPVLKVGSPGSWDDSALDCLCILPEPAGDAFTMWYSGVQGPGLNYRIGMAISGDGLFGWRKDTVRNPTLGSGAPGSWESDHVACPTIIFDGATYHLWYSGGRGASPATIWRMGYATSTDGVQWLRHPKNPVLGPGLPGSWESDRYGYIRVAFKEDRNFYQAWYLAERTSDTNTIAIGYAESPRARRSIVPPAGCRTARPLTVSIREEDDGRDPKFSLHLREIVSGPITSGQVAPSHGGSARDLPRPPVTPAGLFQDGRAVGRVPFCPGGNGSVRFSDGAYALENLGEEIGNAGDSFTFAYSRIQATSPSPPT